jgi:hypothetical protein
LRDKKSQLFSLKPLTNGHFWCIINTERKKEVNKMVELKYIKDLAKGTVLTKEMFDEEARRNAKERRRVYKTTGIRCDYKGLITWENLRTNPEKYELKKLEGFREAKSSKYNAIDVLEMIKSGKTVEEIEPLLYSKIRFIYFEKI